MSFYVKRQPVLRIDWFVALLFYFAIIFSIATLVININNQKQFQNMVAIALFNVLGLTVIVQKNRALDRQISINELNQILIAVVFGLAGMMAASLFIPYAFPYSSLLLDSQHLTKVVLGVFFMVGVAVGEELFFRYFVFLMSYTFSGSIVVSLFSQAAMFALFHATSYGAQGLTASAFVIAFVAGIIFQLQDLVTKRLSTSMITHLIWNATPIIFSMFV